MIINGKVLLERAPIKDMVKTKEKFKGTSYGLSEAGYDIRIAQNISFYPPNATEVMYLLRRDLHSKELSKAMFGYIKTWDSDGKVETHIGRFCLASAMEEFQMHPKLVGTVKDKSTWARQGLSVFNTVCEPRWNGFLTLELVFNSMKPVHIVAGQGIAQVLFSDLIEEGNYGDGKYQNQEAGPVEARS